MFLRLVAGPIYETAQEATGLITIAGLLLKRNKLTNKEKDHLKCYFKWLNKTIPCPPWEYNDWYDNICWFKEKNAWDIIDITKICLIDLVKKYYCVVRELRSNFPGNVVYDDRFQVVCEVDWSKRMRVRYL